MHHTSRLISPPRYNPSDLHRFHLSVVVPAYNEEARLKPSLDRLHQYYSGQPYSYDITIVSDGSKDGTGALVREFASKHPEFRLIEYQPNRGKGYAVRTGMLAAQGDLVLFCDADIATPQEETETLLKQMDQGAQIAIGSRPLRESHLEKRQPLYRELLGRAFNLAVRTLAIREIHDTQCGFKIFTRACAQDVFGRCKFDGFSFDLEVLLIARDLGYTIAEVPIRWSHQEGSKVNMLRDGTRMLRDLIKMRLMGKKGRLGSN